MAEEQKTFQIEDAQLVFRNFEGREDMYNQKGDRNFCVLLTDELAADLANDGWNIKSLKARDEGDDDRPYIEVGVRFDILPPKVFMLTSSTRTALGEKTIDALDWVDIKTVDLICRGYEWGPWNGKSGVKAYLKTIFVTIEEDELEKKYNIHGNPPVHMESGDDD